MSNAFDGLLCSLDDSEEGISELEDRRIETSRSGMQSEKTQKQTKQNIPERWDDIKKE